MIRIIIDKKKCSEEKAQSVEEEAAPVSNEPFQRNLRKIHPKQKKRLIGMGKGKTGAGGGPYKIKVSMKRSKSAPPIGE